MLLFHLYLPRIESDSSRLTLTKNSSFQTPQRLMLVSHVVVATFTGGQVRAEEL